MIMAFDFLGAAGIGTSFLGGVFSGIGANKRQKKAIAAQKEENERARQFNREMAEWYNEQQRINIADERAYNMPIEQMKRLREAGLNPDLVYAHGASGLVDANVADTAQVPAGVPTDVASPIMNTPTMMESMLNGAAFSKMVAETRNIKADTAKKQGEATSLNLDNFVKSASQSNNIELSNLNVKLTKAQANYSEKEINKLISEIEQIDTHVGLLRASVGEVQAKTRNLDSSTQQNRFNMLLNSKRFEVEVQDFIRRTKETDARVQLDNATAKGILVTMYAKVNNLDADTAMKMANVRLTESQKRMVDEQTQLVDIHRDAAEFQLKQDMTYDSAQRIVTIGNQATQSLYHISQIMSDWLPAPGSIAKQLGKALQKGKK